MFPPYNPTLVMKQETADQAGADLAKTIDLIQKPLTDDAMQELDARVDLDKKEPAEVAKEYLQETGLVEVGARSLGRRRAARAPSVRSART